MSLNFKSLVRHLLSRQKFRVNPYFKKGGKSLEKELAPRPLMVLSEFLLDLLDLPSMLLLLPELLLLLLPLHFALNDQT